MGLSYTINHEHQLVWVRYEGVIKNDETYALYRALAASAGPHPGYKELSDLSNAQLLEFTPQEIGDLAASQARFYSGLGRVHRQVFLAPDDVNFAMARVFTTHANFSGHVNATVVRDLPEAADALEFAACDLQHILENLPPTKAVRR